MKWIQYQFQRYDFCGVQHLFEYDTTMGWVRMKEREREGDKESREN